MTGHAVLSAKSVEECIIAQGWDRYTPDDHATWGALFTRQQDTLKGHVCQEYTDGLATLGITEAGVPDFDVTNWVGIMVPAGTPVPVVQKINAEVVKILASPAMKERFNFFGVTPNSSTPEEFRKFLDSEIERWGQVVKAARLPIN